MKSARAFVSGSELGKLPGYVDEQGWKNTIVGFCHVKTVAEFTDVSSAGDVQ